MKRREQQTTVSGGCLRGLPGDVLAFRGVAYARAERFGLPEPVPAWPGVRSADAPGPAPLQVVPDDAPVPGMAVADIGEDCLSAEIRTPGLHGSRPVLVWIPGGSFKIGGNALATYDGSRLAAEGDLVTVALNYRLGMCGFLAADGVPSNLGLRDLIAALTWIRDEIAAFGGDPSRVVVMGESAGAGAVAHLLAVPGIEDLVSGAIIASGAPGATLTSDAAGVVADAVLAAAGTDSVDALRALDADDLLDVQTRADADLLATVGMMPFHPWVDGDILPRSPLDAARQGRLAPVPVVIGTTSQEMELFRDAVPDLPDEFAAAWLAPKVAAVTGSPPADEQVRAGLAAAGDLVEAIADTELHLPAVVLADAHVAAGHSVWRYRFDWQAPTIGAAHAVDLPFHFGTLDAQGWRAFVAGDDAADRLSAAMREAWAAFCHRGTPACAPIGDWPAHDTISRPTIRLGREITIDDDPDAERRRAWLGED
ncbi:MAG: carboxylesterase family protein [Acidimicrobiales bacterium]|nr:carboxylesterase family protein [Acidimicrobiales bacterium]